METILPLTLAHRVLPEHLRWQANQAWAEAVLAHAGLIDVPEVRAALEDVGHARPADWHRVWKRHRDQSANHALWALPRMVRAGLILAEKNPAASVVRALAPFYGNDTRWATIVAAQVIDGLFCAAWNGEPEIGPLLGIVQIAVPFPRFVELTAQVARTALSLVPPEDGRPRHAIEALEAWSQNQVSDEVVMRALLDAADAADQATQAGRYAAASAARAAVHAARIVTDSSHAFDAAVATADALASAEWPRGSQAWAAARTENFVWLANVVRGLEPCPRLSEVLAAQLLPPSAPGEAN